MRAIAALVLTLAMACHPPPPPATRVPATAVVREAGGARFAPAERYVGHPLVIDFWASWCKECKTGVPAVQRLAEAFAGDGVAVLGVNVGEDEATATAAARSLGIGYPIAFDPELEFADAMGATQLPLLIVVGADGAIVHRARGVDEATLAALRAQVGK